MYGTILVGIDEDHHADQAAVAARDLAKSVGDSVVVVHIQPMSSPAVRGTPAPTEASAEADQILANALSMFTDAGVSATGQVYRASLDHIGDALIDLAAREDAGLIVVGSRGRGDMASTMFGSTAHQLIQHSTTPVMVVRDTDHN
ncbi:MAG: universal stress protein [Actinomycetes bacterium]|jgi:nucleotide-binding universal stress UspA family protein